jgi:RNA polymerase sigma factor (sigma-70 family)
MPTDSVVGLERLLGQEQWVRRLARSLIHDSDEADDVLQETRLTSWRRPPRDPDRVRSWLGTVVRNLVRNRGRAEGTRRRLEAESRPAEETAPSAERLAERLEVHRALAEAVARLAEPFREVVLLRYYEDLSSAEIARRLGEPAGTIRWRLKTALGRLRVALDERRRDDGTTWLAALVPLAQHERRSPSPRPSLATGANRAWIGRLALSLGLLGLVVGVVVALHQRGSLVSAASPASGTLAPSALLGPRHVPTPVASLSSSGANARAAADELPAWIQLEGVPPRTIAGHVLSNGRPLGGARLRLSSATLTSARRFDRQAISGADGAFVFPAQPITDWFLTAWAPGLEPMIQYLDLRQATPASRVEGHPLDELVIDLAPCRVFARGTVRDAGGGVLSAARVRFTASWDGAGTEARTDGSGRYELCIPGSNPQARVLTAEASGYGTIEARAPSASGTVDFVLQPQGLVAGRAVGQASGDPVAGVDLVLLPLPLAVSSTPPGERRAPARRESRTDESGRFELTGVAPGRYTLRFASDDLFGAPDDVVTIAAGDHVRGLEVRLSPVAAVDGVVSRAGAPVPQADLRFTPVPGTVGGPGPRRTRSDDHGRFRVRLPKDLRLTIETPADPDRPDARWVPVLEPAMLVAGTQPRDGLRVELPPAQLTAAEAAKFVTPAGAAAPPPGHALEGEFGGQVRLLGYDVATDHVDRGGRLEVTLHFQALAPLEDCRLFTHLVGPSGFMNLDHGPAGGAYPVARWRVGETVRDRFSISIPSQFSPGEYTLLTGFWQPAGNRRLAITPAARDDGEGRFRVLTFKID